MDRSSQTFTTKETCTAWRMQCMLAR